MLILLLDPVISSLGVPFCEAPLCLFLSFLPSLLPFLDSSLSVFQITYADIALFNFWSVISKDYPEALANFPLVSALVARVAARPRIARWLRERPVSEW